MMRSRSRRSHCVRAAASDVENMYLRLSSRWFVNETCEKNRRRVNSIASMEESTETDLEGVLHETPLD
jgi:hypothetical protein